MFAFPSGRWDCQASILVLSFELSCSDSDLDANILPLKCSADADQLFIFSSNTKFLFFLFIYLFWWLKEICLSDETSLHLILISVKLFRRRWRPVQLVKPAREWKIPGKTHDVLNSEKIRMSSGEGHKQHRTPTWLTMQCPSELHRRTLGPVKRGIWPRPASQEPPESPFYLINGDLELGLTCASVFAGPGLCSFTRGHRAGRRCFGSPPMETSSPLLISDSGLACDHSAS